MADYAGAVAALRTRLLTWTTTPIGMVNEPEPATSDANGPIPWVMGEILGTTSRLRGAGLPGSQVWVSSGLVLAHVFVPAGSGTATAFAHAVAIGELFRAEALYASQPPNVVRCWAPRIDGGGAGDDDGKWFRVTCTIPFDYWHQG